MSVRKKPSKSSILKKKIDFALISFLMMFYNGNLHEKIFEYAKKNIAFEPFLKQQISFFCAMCLIW